MFKKSAEEKVDSSRNVTTKSVTSLMRLAGKPKATLLNKEYARSFFLFLETGLLTINAVDSDGRSALMYAANQGNKTVMEHLIRSGADICIADKQSKTALIICAEKGHKDVANDIISFVLDLQINAIRNGNMTTQEEEKFNVFLDQLEDEKIQRFLNNHNTNLLAQYFPTKPLSLEDIHSLSEEERLLLEANHVEISGATQNSSQSQTPSTSPNTQPDGQQQVRTVTCHIL